VSLLALVEEEIEALEDRAVIVQKEGERQTAFRNAFASADSNFLQKIESAQFLKEEQKLLASLGSFGPILKRIDYLSTGKNQALFEELCRRKKGSWLEIERRLTRPVKVDIDDLAQFLTMIEGVSINEKSVPEGRPQMQITNFSLTRSSLSESREVYQLQMSLLTREFE